MQLPKFLLGDNTDFPNGIYIVHTDFPRFVLNLEDDSVEWFEEFDKEDQELLENETELLINAAIAFYDREVARYQ